MAGFPCIGRLAAFQRHSKNLQLCKDVLAW